MIVAGTRFFTVAGPSVGAVKHSGVFSCDWDSLEEENVRHGAWLSACWSSSRGLGENIWRRRPSWASFLILSFSAVCCLFPAALPLHSHLLPLFHLSSGVHLLWFTEAHYQFPANLHPQLASQQQHTTTRSQPQEGRQLDWCLPKNPLLLTCVASPSRHLCCCHCMSLTVL